jgi:hypothetical protein
MHCKDYIHLFSHIFMLQVLLRRFADGRLTRLHASRKIFGSTLHRELSNFTFDKNNTFVLYPVYRILLCIVPLRLSSIVFMS